MSQPHVVIADGDDGVPVGVYQVTFFEVSRKGQLIRLACTQTNPDRLLPHLCLADCEVARAVCVSSPGGAWVHRADKPQHAAAIRQHVEEGR